MLAGSLPLGHPAYGRAVDLPQPIALPVAASIDANRALAEIGAAIELVARGLARRVHITGLAGLDDVAAEGLVRAQAAGVRFALTHDSPGSVNAIIGPRGA